MNAGEGRNAVVRGWFARAAEALASAETSLRDGHLFTTGNRLYYAAFYAVTAVLALRGREFSKHSAVRAAFHRDLAKPGLVSLESATLYDELFRARGAADYDIGATCDPDQLRARLGQVKSFVKTFRSLAGLQE